MSGGNNIFKDGFFNLTEKDEVKLLIYEISDKITQVGDKKHMQQKKLL